MCTSPPPAHSMSRSIVSGLLSFLHAAPACNVAHTSSTPANSFSKHPPRRYQALTPKRHDTRSLTAGSAVLGGVGVQTGEGRGQQGHGGQKHRPGESGGPWARAFLPSCGCARPSPAGLGPGAWEPRAGPPCWFCGSQASLRADGAGTGSWAVGPTARGLEGNTGR